MERRFSSFCRASFSAGLRRWYHHRALTSHPGDATSIALTWAVTALAKAGTLSVHRRLSAAGEDLPHRPWDEQEPRRANGQLQPPRLPAEAHRAGTVGAVDPSKLLSKQEPIGNAIEAYKEFDRREPGWVNVELRPQVH